MSEPKDKNFLKRLQEKVSPQAAMMNLVSGMLPGLAKKLSDLSKPKADGGMLNEGEDKICYLITEHQGEVKMMMVPLIFDRETGQKILGKPLQNTSLQEILTNAD